MIITFLQTKSVLYFFDLVGLMMWSKVFLDSAIPIHQTINILFGVAVAYAPFWSLTESICKLHQDIVWPDSYIDMVKQSYFFS